MQPAGNNAVAPWPPGTLLADLAPAASRDLLSRGVQRHLPPGYVLIRQGERTRHVAVLLTGSVKVTARTADGHEALLAIRVAGDVVGELASMDRQPRSATVTTCSKALVRVLSWAEFHEFLRHQPTAAVAVAGVIGRRLRSANRRRLDFGGYPVRVRLARILIDIADAHGVQTAHGHEIDLTLTQPELAALAGAAEVTVHKALRDLREDGVLDTGYRRLRILDMSGLRRAAQILENPY